MILHVLVALRYLAEISLLARRGITLQLVSFWQGLLILMLSSDNIAVILRLKTRHECAWSLVSVLRQYA